MWQTPKKLLVQIERVPLSQFYELVGEEMCGKDWKRTPAQPPDVSVDTQSQSPVPSYELELKENLVKAQILQALQSGKLTAEFHFKKTALAQQTAIDVQKWVHEKKRKLYKADQRKRRQLGTGSGGNSPLEEEEEEIEVTLTCHRSFIQQLLESPAFVCPVGLVVQQAGMRSPGGA